MAFYTCCDCWWLYNSWKCAVDCTDDDSLSIALKDLSLLPLSEHVVRNSLFSKCKHPQHFLFLACTAFFYMLHNFLIYIDSANNKNSVTCETEEQGVTQDECYLDYQLQYITQKNTLHWLIHTSGPLARPVSFPVLLSHDSLRLQNIGLPICIIHKYINEMQ